VKVTASSQLLLVLRVVVLVLVHPLHHTTAMSSPPPPRTEIPIELVIITEAAETGTATVGSGGERRQTKPIPCWKSCVGSISSA
jgi:hypothetical protein